MVDKMRGYLIGQQTQARHGAFVNDLRKAYAVKVTLDPVRLPVEAKGPGRGAEKPKVTIVMWSDFQCPYCVRAEPTLTQLLAAFPNEVRVVFRHFPLNFHEHAMPAAESSACADEQGQFWPLHDWFVSGQSDLTRPATRAFLGQRPGFDLAKFDECLTSGRGLKVVEADQAAGERLTVDGTPAFFVNGIKLGGALPYDQFEALVKTEIAR
jgi:protein-disulfide isomerase